MSANSLSKEEKIAKVFDLYATYGQNDYIGEPVSQIEHMCQAASIAEERGHDEEVILAAFFHDIGHLLVADQNLEKMGEFGVFNHEKIGADYLRNLGFPERMAKLVENHVHAKRYLTYKLPAYYEKLSEASKATLTYQGGMMDEVEARNFEKDETFDLSLKMRTWDEMAKEENLDLPDLEKYRVMALRVLL